MKGHKNVWVRLVFSLFRSLFSLSVFRCQKDSCGGLLRPHVVWFGESLDPEVLDAADEELSKCDLCLVVSTNIISF